ncbi:MAG TPA: fimbria/pilus outer membrane usher protein [Allosphingosinicella sp.]
MRQSVLVEVSVNGSPAGEPVLLLKEPDGTLYAPEQAFVGWRLKRGAPAFSEDGKTYYPLSGVPGLALELIEATQTLLLTAPPNLLEPTRLTYRAGDSAPMTPSATGGFLNYDLLGQLADGEASINGAVELGAFTPLGVGVSSFVGQWSGRGAGLVRLETNWTIDDPVRMRSLRVGDSITRGGVGAAPLRFGGIQLARNFAVQPGFVTLPMPSLQGSAAVPSVVDIYVNNALSDSREVPPGPFEITGVPIVTGSGEVQLVVRDLLGRQTLVSQSYYAAPQLLRRGLHDFSYELGFLRSNFGRRSYGYGALLVAATHRYGFSDALTGEVHLEATKDVQAAGVGASLVLPGIGLIDASIAGSRSDRGQGAQVGFGLERRTRDISLGIVAELTTADYVSVGQRPDKPPPAAVIQAFAGIPIRSGSLGFSYLWRDGRNEPDVELVSANASLRLGALGTLYLAGRKSLRGPKDAAVELVLSVALGRRTSASAGAELRNGSAMLTASLHRNLPAGDGFGYRAAMAVGDTPRFDGRLSAQTGFGAYDAELSWVDGKSGVRVVVSGGIGVVGNQVFASRKLSQSFAVVQVGDYPGVRVYADNQLVGTTDDRGRAVIPRLRPFDRNVVRIDATDLPLDAELAGDERNVRPYNRSGVAVDFGVKRTHGALVVILLDDGSFLPAGVSVHLNGSEEEFVSAPGGEVYLTGLLADNMVQARWSSGSCGFKLPFAETVDPQPRLGEFRCRAVDR